jgi:hypothetical protein
MNKVRKNINGANENTEALESGMIAIDNKNIKGCGW